MALVYEYCMRCGKLISAGVTGRTPFGGKPIYETDTKIERRDKLCFECFEPKKIKRVYSEKDPFGEENWSE